MLNTPTFTRRSFMQSLLAAGALLAVPGALSATAARADDAKKTRTIDTDKGPGPRVSRGPQATRLPTTTSASCWLSTLSRSSRAPTRSTTPSSRG